MSISLKIALNNRGMAVCAKLTVEIIMNFNVARSIATGNAELSFLQRGQNDSFLGITL